MDFSNQLSSFQNYLLENDRSNKTIVEYSNDIILFHDYVQAILKKELEDINNIDIRAYKDYMIYDKKYNIKTVNRKLVSINQFMLYSQIAVSIKQEKVQVPNFLSNLLTNNDVARILDVAKSHNDIRFITIIQTLRLTGMRVSECMQLSIDDIDKSSISIIGKGRKHREVLIPNSLNSIWCYYIQYRIIPKNTVTNKLFTSQKGNYTVRSVEKKLHEYGSIIGIDKAKLHPHNLRHLYSLNLVDKNIDIVTISSLLGHSSLNTCKIYLTKSKESLLDIINNL